MDHNSNKDPRKENDMVSVVWGESESDEEDYDKRGMTFVTSLDIHVSPSAKNFPYKQITIEKK